MATTISLGYETKQKLKQFQREHNLRTADIAINQLLSSNSLIDTVEDIPSNQVNAKSSTKKRLRLKERESNLPETQLSEVEVQQTPKLSAVKDFIFNDKELTYLIGINRECFEFLLVNLAHKV